MKCTILLLTSLVSLLGLPVGCLGEGGELASPSLTYPSNIDADRKEEIADLLNLKRGRLKFIEGHFINEFSSQRFGGKAGDVVDFITRLQRVGLWQVDVQFRDFGEQKSAFSLDQNSATMYLRVIINSGRDDFTLRDFRDFLPRPALPKSTLAQPERSQAEDRHDSSKHSR